MFRFWFMGARIYYVVVLYEGVPPRIDEALGITHCHNLVLSTVWSCNTGDAVSSTY